MERVQYDGLCRKIDPDEAARRIAAGEKYIIRFKMPREGATTAHDHLRGDIVTENRYLDDYVLMKSDGLPTYHLAAMVDDHEMQVTHVLRGSEWLSTFPLHVNIVRAFGWDEPVWIHLSVFLKPGGKVVICDFFKTEHHGDGGPGDGSFGGGHAMADFYRKVKESKFELIRDEDITKRVSPNLQLVNDFLHNTIKPVGLTLNKYLSDNYPKLSWIAHKLLRKKLDRMNYKYFEGHRSKATFERYKTYHLLVCQLKA